MNKTILETHNLSLDYLQDAKRISVLHDVSLSIDQGDTIGIVGESGCGKSTLAHAITGLLGPNAEITSGQVVYMGRDLYELSDEEKREIRGKGIGIIFQNPMTALNPTVTLRKQLYYILEKNGVDKNSKEEVALNLFKKVGIPAAEKRLDEYIHEYSGGMRQRAMIAMVLASKPKLLIADEPTTALDVTIQKQILTLIKSLVDEMNMALILITHDLAVVKDMCEKVAVMYAGRIVEISDKDSFFRNANHPYSRALLRSIPSISSDRKTELEVIEGMPPDLSKKIEGCAFSPRCKYKKASCTHTEQELKKISDGRAVACDVVLNEEGKSR